MLTAQVVVAKIDAAVHDVIVQQQRGKKRQAAINSTVSTTLSIVEVAVAEPEKLRRVSRG